MASFAHKDTKVQTVANTVLAERGLWDLEIQISKRAQFYGVRIPATFPGAGAAERAVPNSPAGQGRERQQNVGRPVVTGHVLPFPLIILGRLPGSGDCGCGLGDGEIFQAFGAIAGKELKDKERREYSRSVQSPGKQ